LEKTCKNCKFIAMDPVAFHPCRDCFKADNWEPIGMKLAKVDLNSRELELIGRGLRDSYMKMSAWRDESDEVMQEIDELENKIEKIRKAAEAAKQNI
jgi:hypothetical protein